MSEIPTVEISNTDALRSHISDDFGAWGPEVLVTQEMINQFAEITGDHQWIHIDVERAKAESPFGGPIAHGFLTLSLLPMLNTPAVNLSGIKNAVNYGSDGFRFLAPVPAGATIHAKSRLADVEDHKRGTLVTTEVAVHVKDAEKPSLLYKMKILYQG